MSARVTKISRTSSLAVCSKSTHFCWSSVQPVAWEKVSSLTRQRYPNNLKLSECSLDSVKLRTCITKMGVAMADLHISYSLPNWCVCMHVEQCVHSDNKNGHDIGTGMVPCYFNVTSLVPHETAAISVCFVYTMQPHTSLQCHFIQSRKCKVHACLAVTCQQTQVKTWSAQIQAINFT